MKNIIIFLTILLLSFTTLAHDKPTTSVTIQGDGFSLSYGTPYRTEYMWPYYSQQYYDGYIFYNYRSPPRYNHYRQRGHNKHYRRYDHDRRPNNNHRGHNKSQNKQYRKR